MDTSTPPRGGAPRQRLSHVLGGPAGLRFRDYRFVIIIVALGLVAATAVVLVAPRSLDESAPDWAEPQTLPTAKPVWTEDVGEDDTVLTHKGMLIRATDADDGHIVTVNELSTGDEILSLEADLWGSWLSGDFLITQAAKASEVVVHDIQSGEEVRTIATAENAFLTVASGVLVSVEMDGEKKSRMRGIEVSTGEEKWTKSVATSWFKLAVDSPGVEPNYRSFGGSKLRAESTSPVFLLRNDDKTASGMWEEVEAFDVTTGEASWDSPVRYTDSKPTDLGFHLLDSGDIYTQVASGSGSETATSYVIDAETGKATEYAGTPEESSTAVTTMLHGDKLLTTSGAKPALVDVDSGKTLWSTDAEGALMNGGDVIFRSVDARNPDAKKIMDSFIDGMRAYDTATGKTLWTKQGTYDKIDVVGDEMITTAFSKAKEDVKPIQVFDWRTGKGKWQLAVGELVAHDDDHFVFVDPDDGSTLSVVSRKNPR